MSILTALDHLLLGPLKLFFEVLFVIADRLIENEGLAIIVLSLAMNFLVLPLYRRADAMQAEERDLEERLQPWVTHIKKTFTGDERYMILQTFYRQNNYKPTYALKGSLSLLLEIPFFIAAYQFLSGLERLRGVSFGPIADLGAPDGMLVIGGLAINLLPILMTAINIVSGAIYTKGYSLKSKIQLYGMALIFLVFLYNSPAGLVFYWTLNNLFSLVKNVFYKLKDPKKVLTIMASAAGVVIFAGSLFLPGMRHNYIGIAVMLVFGLALQAPLVIRLMKKRGVRMDRLAFEGKPDRKMFFLGAAFITILLGVLIPSAVIGDSPLEFIEFDNYLHPLWYVVNSTLLAAGTFVVWFGVFYMLVSDEAKKVMEALVWILCGVFVVDYMFFGTHLGNLSALLKLDTNPMYTLGQMGLNLAVLAVLAVAFWLLIRKKKAVVQAAYIAGILALGAMSVMNVAKVGRAVADASVQQKLEEREKSDDLPYLTLSRDKPNVVVLMLDRAISSFVPYEFAEKPELYDMYEGFTFYPNALSHGGTTNFGTPALFGGYEYTPKAMNARSDELLKDKHNEALLLMPTLFGENGYDVTVCDPPYAGNYQWVPDLSIYDDIPNTKAFITDGAFLYDRADAHQLRYRNFFCYSLFKACPLICQPTLYFKGSYNGVETTQVCTSISTATGLDNNFMEAYAVLTNLPAITRISDDEEEGCLVLMVNNATHEPCMLKEPEYEPAKIIDNTEYDAAHADRFTMGDSQVVIDNWVQMVHYQANVATFLKVGEWLDWLRENDLYDNTRIIIVSDHGRGLGCRPDMMVRGVTDTMSYNPLFMVKDFGDNEPFRQDDTFMTLGDVPVLAMEGIIDDPVNPATGNPVNSDEKQNDQFVSTSSMWDTDINNGYTFMEAVWYSVRDNVFDAENWTLVGYE